MLKWIFVIQITRKILENCFKDQSVFITDMIQYQLPRYDSDTFLNLELWEGGGQQNCYGVDHCDARGPAPLNLLSVYDIRPC